MNTRQAARAYTTRQAHSESNNDSMDNPSQRNVTSSDTVYLIDYPIGKSSCLICHDNLPELNLKIREHLSDAHSITDIKYSCKCCGKTYENISSIKSHHPACKRKHNTPIAANTSPAQLMPSATTSKDTSNIPALQCIECSSKQITFTAKDKKGLVTHMRTKHPREYEESKTVANIRVAWNSDEDRILANLEIRLKSIQKGQILDRLYTEWNELVRQSHANYRSKEAIRGRRQQAEYKATLADLQSQTSRIDQQIDTLSQDSLSSVESDSDSIQQIATENEDVSAIEQTLKSIALAGHIKLSTYMKDAINAFLSPNLAIDPVELSMLGIQQSLTSIRNKNSNSVNSHRANRVAVASNKKHARNPSRIKKAQQHAYYEHLYMKNKPRLMDELVDGVAPNADPPPIHVAVQFYEQIWSTRAHDTYSVEKKVDIQSDNCSLLSPITKSDIDTVIKRTKRDTAKGIDQVTLHEAKLLAEEDLIVAFNIWLGCRRIPSDLKLNRTTLIPKGKEGLDNITNWRPITISSILLRLFNKIIGFRMSKYFEIDKRQMGFTPVNGCSMNILWLHHLLKHARLNKNEINVCLIDVAKAFDSVPHDSIYRALVRHRAPKSFIDLVQNQYENSSTSIAYRDLCSKKIRILRGVKQGDALSPLLFNLVTDELFDILGDQFGYRINNIGSSNIKCFADDICLVSGSKIGMGHMINATVKFLNERGLQVNAKKCMSIGLEKGYKGKKSKIVVEPVFTIQGTLVPILGHVDNYTKYLGIQFTSVGSVHASAVKDRIKAVLEALQKIPLKPHHKIDLLRSHVIPLFIYQLINLELYPKLLKQIDINIRRTIRSILHLPVSLSTEFYYLPIREGGLQLPLLRDVIGLAKVRIYKSIMRSDDVFLKHLVETQGYSIVHRFTNELKLDSSFESDDIKQRKIELMKERRVSFGNKVHGYGSEVFATCPLTNSWLFGGCRTMSGRTFINSIKLRTNTLETKVTLTRGLLVDKTCRRCKSENESIMHILQYCKSTQGLRYQRHNQVCSRVVAKLRERGFDVFVEKAFNTDVTGLPLLRPDIIAVKDNHAFVIDIQNVYECSGASFTNAYNLKVQKYTPLVRAIKERHRCSEVTFRILVVGSRGSFHHGHLSMWYSFGFTSSELKYLAINCMENSLRIVSSFHRSLQHSG